MTRALITGVTGFVGSYLAEYLIDTTDWEIFGLLRWQDSLENMEKTVPLDGDRVQFVYADLRDTIAIRNVIREVIPDYVFHLAAQSYPLTSFTSPLDTMDTNIQGTVRLLDAIKEFCPKAMVHICSSSEVYGRVSKEHVPITEDTPFHPASPYAISKIGTDLVGKFYAEAYGMNTMITRMFTHTGPRRGDVFAESSFAKQIAMIEAKLIPPLVKVGNLASLRTLADVRDAVRAYYMLLTINPIAGEVYNIGGTHTCTVGDILDTLLSKTSMNIEVKVDPSRLRPLDADLQIPDCTKFMKHTGWKPEIPFEQTMTDLLDYWRERIKTGAYLTR
ncbi:hypothetical protein LCGC14_1828680 [marine sediment metagenome]|uniref:NAD(P)-binding domain-containing protein n=1 Tax=marine sediment metagenome TaxID=412755 RepID=A0A0F9GGQ3_9ZZZZ